VIRAAIVDDDFRVAALHRAYTERVPGFSVVGEARTGADALALVERVKPDLVLLDIYLPDMSGLDVLRAFQRDSGKLGKAIQRDLEKAAKAVRSRASSGTAKRSTGARRSTARKSTARKSTARKSTARKTPARRKAAARR